MIKEYQALIEGFKNAGIKAGMTLVVHSSFTSLHLQKLGPQDVIEALMEVIGEKGNILMPTLTYDVVNENNPYFDLNNTPSSVGVISEVFRQQKGVIRSLNPIHSVAVWGKDKIELTNNHYLDEITIGLNSPYYKMLKYNAKILMLGSTLKPNTFMHLVENLNELPYRKIKREFIVEIKNNDGVKINNVVKLPNMSNFYQRYDKIINILSEKDLQKVSINGEESFLIEANELLKKASEILEKEPYYFVDKIK